MQTYFSRLFFAHFAGCLFLCVLCGFGCSSVQAQEKSSTPKADSYFNNNEFLKAIPLYEKVADKDDDALRKLADCYRILKNYPKAEQTYGKLVAKQSTDPMVYYYYGAALLSNNKYDEAKKQFSVYSILRPDDNKGEIYAKVCDKAKELAGKPALYKAYNLGEINTPVADFSPVFYKDGLVFSSEKIKDLISSGGSSGSPYLSLVFSKGEKTGPRTADTSKASGKDSILYADAKLFSEKLSQGGHYGPACFSADFSEIYFMKVDAGGKKGTVSQPKIYYSKNTGTWSTPEMLSFCSDLYATGHPTLSEDGQFLYFISNMPGGWGGTDIWVSKKEGDKWSIPKNLGKEINTAEDEAYPYIADKILYFSSKGHAGFGGLDIYASVQKSLPDGKTGGKWGGPSNLMPPINSTANDFGIIFRDENRGYFSSNRPGGKGSDDLYGFGLSGLITTVSGKVLLSMNTADAAPNVKVFLLTSKGEVLKTIVTDASGFFKFENLLSDQAYMVKVDESDPVFSNMKRLYLTDASDRVVRVATKNKDGFFVFEYLPADQNRLSTITEQDVSIVGNFYAGDERIPVGNAKVNLVNSKNEVVSTITTDAQGAFAFMHLPKGEDVTLAIEGIDPKFLSKKIYFTNKNGKEIAVCNGRTCEFSILATDEQTLSLLKVEDSQLLIDFEGILYSSKSKTPLGKTTIYLVDENGNVVGTYQTTASGNFKFTGLPGDKTYMIKLKEDDMTLSTKDVFMADTKGRIVATLKSGGKFFRYSLLAAEEQTMAKIYFNDPWLQAGKLQMVDKSGQMTIIENIYYEYQKWDLGPQAMINLNKVAGIMLENPDMIILLIAHTDARGSSDFNAELSQKRAQAAVDYIISKGIASNRLTARGVGESKLVNRCKDGVECSEEDHAQNRRTEFRVKKGGS